MVFGLKFRLLVSERNDDISTLAQDLRERQSQDLGAMFGDPSLNSRFEDREGRVQPLYHYQQRDGQTYLTCVLCGVTGLFTNA